VGAAGDGKAIGGVETARVVLVKAVQRMEAREAG
jgi:hypothetical protein